MEVRIYVNSKGLGLPSLFKSRTILLMTLLGALNLYDQYGDVQQLLSSYGIVPDPRLMTWINMAGFALGAYFRASAKQPLGAAGRTGALSHEELQELKSQVRKELEQERQL